MFYVELKKKKRTMLKCDEKKKENIIAIEHRSNVCSHAHTTKMEILYHEKKKNKKTNFMLQNKKDVYKI